MIEHLFAVFFICSSHAPNCVLPSGRTFLLEASDMAFCQSKSKGAIKDSGRDPDDYVIHCTRIY